MKKILLFFILVIIPLTLSSCIFSSDLSIKDISFFGRGEFKWGAGINPYPTGVEIPEVFNGVLERAKSLGISWLRMEVPNWRDDNFAFADPLIKEAQSRGFNVVVGFQPDKDFQELGDPYKAGYEQAYKIAEHYPNIKYFQLANEPATGALKKDWPGIDENSFIPEKYQKVLGWLKGASEGIAKANPKAKRAITGHWLHFGFFEMLNKDKLKYEIIGWDWHQENSDLSKIDSQGKTFNLYDELKKTKKELWITEADLYGGSNPGEEAQAEFLKKLAQQVYDSGVFSGFFVFNLFDEYHKAGSTDANLGITKIKQENNIWQLSDPKKAYYSYQEIIKQLSKK